MKMPLVVSSQTTIRWYNSVFLAIKNTLLCYNSRFCLHKQQLGGTITCFLQQKIYYCVIVVVCVFTNNGGFCHYLKTLQVYHYQYFVFNLQLTTQNVKFVFSV